VGDTGPHHKLGEGSIAFNQYLKYGTLDPKRWRAVNYVQVRSEVSGVQISASQPVQILILKQTADSYEGDYGAERVRRITQSLFDRWGGGNGDGSKLEAARLRMRSCSTQHKWPRNS
jgi:hypothetical protein